MGINAPHKPFIPIVLTLFVANGWLAWQFPLQPRYRQQLADIRTFAPTLHDGFIYAAVLCVMFTACWLAYRRAQTNSLPTRFMLIASFVIGLPLLFVYPINANDIFRYVLRGRIIAAYGANPYASPPTDFPDDPFLHLAGEWATATSPYGPVWETVDALIGVLSGDNLLLALIAFKLFGLLMMIASGWIIAQLTSHRAVLWCWNPALFLMFVVDAHNDVLMLLWLLLAFWLTRHLKLGYQRAVVATVIAVLSPLTKLTGIVFVPFLAIELLRRLPDWSSRLRYIIGSAVGSIFVTAAAFVPFGDPRLLVTRLLSETQGGGAFSPLTYIYFVDQRVDVFQINIGDWVEYAGVWFIVVAGLMVMWGIFGRNPLRATADTYYAYLLTAFNYRIWYALWIFPWTLLDETSESRLRFSYLFLITSQLSVVLYGHIREFRLDSSTARAHLWGVPFVFLLPIVGTVLWSYAIRRR